MLQANITTPLYIQLYDKLRQAIDDGTFEIGKQLPSERRLAANHGICRLTARRAIRLLQREGYARAYQGRGYFVAQSSAATSRRTLLEDATPTTIRQETATSRVLSCDVIPADGDVAVHLRIGPRAETLCIRQLQFTNTKPVALTTAYLPYPLCAPLLDINLEQLPLHRALEQQLDIHLAYTNQTVRHALGTDSDLPLLGLRPPATVFQVLGETFDSAGQPIEFVNGVYRDDAYEMHPFVLKAGI